MSKLKAGRPSTSKKEKAIADVVSSSDNMVKMNVNITKALHKKMKQKALDNDTTVTTLVINALNEFLSK
jgi:predicted HicB family RNase H-like nuclease